MASVENRSLKMFGPLTFEFTNADSLQESTETQCLICNNSFNLTLSLPFFLNHIFDVHNIVIEDVQNIEYLHEYVLYWRNRLSTSSLEQIIPSVDMDSSGRKYFLFSKLLKEDKDLRHKLKLDYVLKVQDFERNDKNFNRQCLFCRLEFQGTRHNYLDHLSTQHNLQLGNPQNLVYVEELVEKIDEMMTTYHCLFCGKTFPERNILKEHMRKKLHKRINPQKKEYDKYYIVNYLEVDKSWQAIQKENDACVINSDVEGNMDEEYSDWNEKEDQIICLFCEMKDTSINILCLHMDADHDFDFVQSTKDLDFYQKIKLVNYIRRQIHRNTCVYCEKGFDTTEQLTSHFIREKHYKIPELKMFDQPEFYFPTYENDAFLYFIDDVEDDVK